MSRYIHLKGHPKEKDRRYKGIIKGSRTKGKLTVRLKFKQWRKSKKYKLPKLLSSDCKVVIFDEPTAHSDVRAKFEVQVY